MVSLLGLDCADFQNYRVEQAKSLSTLDSPVLGEVTTFQVLSQLQAVSCRTPVSYVSMQTQICVNTMEICTFWWRPHLNPLLAHLGLGQADVESMKRLERARNSTPAMPLNQHFSFSCRKKAINGNSDPHEAMGPSSVASTTGPGRRGRSQTCAWRRTTDNYYVTSFVLALYSVTRMEEVTYL